MRYALAIAFLAATTPAFAAGVPVVEITIKDHKFTPATVEVPANQKVKLVVKNLDASAEEFESYELNREKVIAGNAEAIIFVGPLEPGTYPFFGDFNKATAQGKIVAK